MRANQRCYLKCELTAYKIQHLDLSSIEFFGVHHQLFTLSYNYSSLLPLWKFECKVRLAVQLIKNVWISLCSRPKVFMFWCLIKHSECKLAFSLRYLKQCTTRIGKRKHTLIWRNVGCYFNVVFQQMVNIGVIIVLPFPINLYTNTIFSTNLQKMLWRREGNDKR